MNKSNIGIITFPISDAGNIPLSNLIDILHSLSSNLYLITGNDGYTFFKEDKRIHTYGVKHEKGKNTFTRILRYIHTQLKISYKLGKISRNIDLWIFFIGGDTLVLPMLTAKLLRKKVVLASVSSSLQTVKSANDNLSNPVEILENINRSLSNRIILHSLNLIKEWNLEKYKDKVSIAHEYFIEFDKFKIKKKLNKRDNLVGYVGRLSEEKGVLNFVKAIPEMKETDGIKFLIGGDGHLRSEIKRYLNEKNLNNGVKLSGWISHDNLPDYLNELRLLVIPSYTESGPIIALETMACSTLVLATPVGVIPDVIKDGETGFVMENNSPECIARNIIRTLNHPNLEKIAENARRLVKRKFSYEVAVEKYRKALTNI